MNKFVKALLVALAVFSFSDFAQAQRGFAPARPEHRPGRDRRPDWDRRPNNDRRPHGDRRPGWDRRPERRPEWDRRDERCWDETDRAAAKVVRLSYSVSSKLNQEIYRMDYGLRRTLQNLVDAALEFKSSTTRYRDFSYSVYELRRLARALDDVEDALRFVPEARCVDDELDELQENVHILRYIFSQD